MVPDYWSTKLLDQWLALNDSVYGVQLGDWIRFYLNAPVETMVVYHRLHEEAPTSPLQIFRVSHLRTRHRGSNKLDPPYSPGSGRTASGLIWLCKYVPSLIAIVTHVSARHGKSIAAP